MEKITRKSIAFEAQQLARFDKEIDRKGYTNRSEAIRDLIRDYLIDVKTQGDANERVMGTLTFIYDHHAKDIQYNLTHLQHHHAVVQSSLHIHIDKVRCMEVLVLEGNAGEIRSLADKILAMKGVESGKLVVTSPV